MGYRIETFKNLHKSPFTDYVIGRTVPYEIALEFTIKVRIAVNVTK